MAWLQSVLDDFRPHGVRLPPASPEGGWISPNTQIDLVHPAAPTLENMPRAAKAVFGATWQTPVCRPQKRGLKVGKVGCGSRQIV